MTIFCIAQDSDPEVEALLLYLNAKTQLSLTDKRNILLRTEDWLRRMDGVEYPSATVEVKASLDDIELLLPLKRGNIPQRGREEQVYPEVGKLWVEEQFLCHP